MSRSTQIHPLALPLDGSSITRVKLVWRYLVAVGIIIAAVWLPRGLDLNRFVTVDEPTWLTFSANFYRALVHGDFARTYQIEHPGVTTMWTGTAAYLWRYPEYAYEAPGQVNWLEQEVGPFLREHGHDPVDVLAAGRALMVLNITVVLTLAFWVAARLLGLATALLGFLLIALDPFHIALSRVLHVDGLMSCLLLLALLAFLNYLYNGRRRLDLVISAVAAGVAWLTKTPAFFLIPFVGLLVLIEPVLRWIREKRLTANDLRSSVLPLVIWGVVGLLVFTLLWPAMWVEPLQTLRALFGAMLFYAREGHETAIFFNGAIVEGDPGFPFYPITWLWRTTPVVLVGLGLAVVALFAPQTKWMLPIPRRVAFVLLVFALLFTLFMSFGAKKFDRYVLPIYAPLDLVAAMGWIAAARWLQQNLGSVARLGAGVMVCLAVLAQTATAIPAHPWYFSYYNPLLGGPQKAREVMMIGWGEGLGETARYLNGLPNAEELQVIAPVWNTTFNYLFKGRHLYGQYRPDAESRLEWTTSDYFVIYINPRQRGRIPPDLLAYLDKLTPVKVVRLQGLEYVWVYDIRTAPIPDFLLGERAKEQ